MGGLLSYNLEKDALNRFKILTLQMLQLFLNTGKKLFIFLARFILGICKHKTKSRIIINAGISGILIVIINFIISKNYQDSVGCYCTFQNAQYAIVASD